MPLGRSNELFVPRVQAVGRISASISGNIGASLSGCGLTKVMVVVGGTPQTLWENGNPASPLPSVAIGYTYEIHTIYNIRSDSDCSWAITCMCNNVPAPPGIHGERTLAAISRDGQTGWNFNCPAMPAGGASVRIKFWYIADHLTDYPAQNLW
jgi:hypothetical protein